MLGRICLQMQSQQSCYNSNQTFLVKILAIRPDEIHAQIFNLVLNTHSGIITDHEETYYCHFEQTVKLFPKYFHVHRLVLLFSFVRKTNFVWGSVSAQNSLLFCIIITLITIPIIIIIVIIQTYTYFLIYLKMLRANDTYLAPNKTFKSHKYTPDLTIQRPCYNMIQTKDKRWRMGKSALETSVLDITSL